MCLYAATAKLVCSKRQAGNGNMQNCTHNNRENETTAVQSFVTVRKVQGGNGACLQFWVSSPIDDNHHTPLSFPGLILRGTGSLLSVCVDMEI